MLHSVESSLIVIRRSDRIIFRTFATISTFLDVEGRPARESSLMSSRPSINLLCHSNVLDRLIASSSNAFLIISKVSVADLPSLTQNLMQTRCSSLFDMTKTAHTLKVSDFNEFSFITNS
ncbi:unnamed protein product [Macrosiphum euphorbiae]|uniref:Uncharacterized protein n=1 Tax=Macrosiphum euphorbiae TaxID=13131 RepID=A0AAV0VTK1_9HEMI|nr:unnamed protein product [Macrosiphum euphorbiae]CAI6374936.1 unnamed protein product [Macrosiphum euphorbiae]